MKHIGPWIEQNQLRLRLLCMESVRMAPYKVTQAQDMIRGIVSDVREAIWNGRGF